MPKLTREFYARPAVAVARDLLGCVVTHVDPDEGFVRRARIVETEAYAGPHDLACHASKGMTNRTRIMFGPPGYAYLYLIYGMHWCFNVVTERAGFPAAVLVRAAVPLENCDGHLSGPGAFCRALHLDARRKDEDLTGDALFIEARGLGRVRVARGPRVNVDYAGEYVDKPWRFAIAGERAVSRPRPFVVPRAKRR